MTTRRGLRNVVVAYPVAVPWMALFVKGVAEYGEQHGGWNLTTSPPTLAGAEEVAQTVRDLRGWPADGVLASINHPAEARAARRLRIPVVNFSGAMQNAGLPRVMVDQYAIGRIAAEHLLERGHRRLAYYGLKGLWYSERRRQGFLQRVEQAGAHCEVFETAIPASSRVSWRQRVAPLVRWLRGLKPPIGLLAVQDYRARAVLDACSQLGLNVPHDVAILGVDNDTTVCEFCRPTLSSVSRGAWRTGYEAAAVLDGLMAGKAAPPDDVLVAPDGVVARQSTDTVAVDDRHVAAAVHFMRDHAGEPFNIAQVIKHVQISRRQLEQRFHRLFGCTPLDYLCRLRVEQVKDLLAAPQRVKLEAIAARCGFASEERMRLVFRRLTGTTPLGYRRDRQAHDKAIESG